MVDLVIRNARLTLPEGIIRGELAIEEGRISEIAASGLPKADREIDAKEKIVMPGVIDIHVHFYDRHYLPREDFQNGSTAAAAGGVTSVIVMPLDTPMLTPRTIKNTIELGQNESLIDFQKKYYQRVAQILEENKAEKTELKDQLKYALEQVLLLDRRIKRISDGTSYQIAFAFARAARPSMDTLKLPFQLFFLILNHQ